MNTKEIPYKIYLDEQEMPKQWYNLRADMKNKPAPLLNPSTLKPMTAEELSQVFCEELVKQELDNDTPSVSYTHLDVYKRQELNHMLHRLCGHPSIPLSFILANVLLRRLSLIHI